MFAPHLSRVEGKADRIHFFLRTSPVRTPLPENWSPHQVSAEELWARHNTNVLPFSISENYPCYSGAARVGSDNYSLDTHTDSLSLSGRNSVFIIHFKVFPVLPLLRTWEQTWEEGRLTVISLFWRKRRHNNLLWATEAERTCIPACHSGMSIPLRTKKQDPN